MNHRKIVSYKKILEEREFSKQVEMFGIKKFFIFTNGCFDLFHSGHASLLSSIKNACTLNSRLIVGINSDSSVRSLKENNRPILNAKQRAYTVACHESVDYVFIFDTKTVAKQLRELQPDFWCKGGDYSHESLKKTELNAFWENPTAGAIKFIPFIDNISTSDIINKIK
tara:strand:+ start:205 stop:711 length:507 start_codon:yes stop_codon:yes gene_type:complete